MMIGQMNRREALASMGAFAAMAALGASAKSGWNISTFAADVTPPPGHPLLAISGRGPKALRVLDRLSAKGIVLTGPDRPIVIVSVDWCELRNDAYARWREALAKAAGTTVDRVLLSCVHQHDAPYFDLRAQELLAAANGPMLGDLTFHEQVVERVAAALTKSLRSARAVTHVGTGQAKVDGIASNRRIEPDGRVSFRRFSTARDAAVRALPDGMIDPWLKTISFWNDETPLAAISSYACHPMSNYGGNEVSGDFVNIARDRRQADLPGVFQVYMTGCSGDVTAGKYNDGSTGVRATLADQLYSAMTEAWKTTVRHPLETIAVRSAPLLLPHGELPALQADALGAKLADPKTPPAQRVLAALGLSSLERNPEGHRIDLSAIDFGRALLVLFPAESFVYYQLEAQRLRPDAFVMCIGFGESAPGYIPTDAAFREGFREEHGYCWVAPGAEGRIIDALSKAIGK